MKHRYNILFVIAAAIGFMSSCKNTTDYSKYRQPLSVEVIQMQEQVQVGTRSYVGTVEEATSLNLSFPLGGKLTHIYVSKNQQVRAGQAIAQIDDTQQRSLLRTAQATLLQAEDGYKRLKQVYDEGAVAEVKWIEMQTQLQKAQAAVESAQKSLDDCTLRAPEAGIVSECDIREGQQLLPGQRVVTLIDVSGVNVRFAVPENEIAAVQVGCEAAITVAALNNQQYEGRVTERDMTANRLSHSYDVKVALRNNTAGRLPAYPNIANTAGGTPASQYTLLPGMVCKVRLRKDEVRGFVVPAKCVQVREQCKTVWVVDDEQKAHLRAVEISHYAGDGVIVTSGLQAGESVVVSGYQKLYEGADVELLNCK